MILSQTLQALPIGQVAQRVVEKDLVHYFSIQVVPPFVSMASQEKVMFIFKSMPLLETLSMEVSQSNRKHFQPCHASAVKPEYMAELTAQELEYYSRCMSSFLLML